MNLYFLKLVTVANFNAATHVNSFTNTFQDLGFGRVFGFAIAQTADSTALNPKITRLLNILHITCRNHTLNLACKDMEACDFDLQRLSIYTQEAHRTIRGSNKLTAAMYNVQQCAYRLKMLVATRWNSGCDMFESHIKAMKEIRAVAEVFPGRVDGCTVTKDFWGDTKKHGAYLSRIKEASCLCQTKKAALVDYQGTFDLLNEMVQDGK